MPLAALRPVYLVVEEFATSHTVTSSRVLQMRAVRTRTVIMAMLDPKNDEERAVTESKTIE